MHSNLLASSLFVAAFMAVFVIALPGSGTGSSNSSCEQGSLQCCNSVQSLDSKDVKAAIKNLDLENVGIPANATLGLTCTPSAALAAAGKSCSFQTVCCTGTNYSNGVLIVGCTAATVSSN